MNIAGLMGMMGIDAHIGGTHVVFVVSVKRGGGRLLEIVG